jgi:branched-chain amino acid transport system permease protein
MRIASYIACGVILIILPPILPTYLQAIMAKFLIYAIFAMSMDLIMGYTGLLSLGQSSFFGAAGYASGILMVHYGVSSFWVNAPFGILIATAIAAIFGFIALRLFQVYFMLITFALSQLLLAVAWRWKSVTGGSNGLPGILRPDLGLSWFTWNSINFYYFILLLFIICYFILHRIVNSPFGHVLQGVRENEPRMSAMGYYTWFYKYIAFIIGGLFAGIAGTLFAYYNGFIYPLCFGIHYSFLPLMMIIVGGMGTLFGPVIGSFLITFLEYFTSMYAPERWPLIFGGIFVVVIMSFRKGGIASLLIKLWGKKGLSYYGKVKGQGPD